jgi:hypothetical protein
LAGGRFRISARRNAHRVGAEVHAFADSNDGGRGGAFNGTWRPGGRAAEDGIDGRFVIQCKHLKKAAC